MIGSLLKAAAVVVYVPASAVRDVLSPIVLMEMYEDPRTGSHTGDALGRFFENVKDVTDPDK